MNANDAKPRDRRYLPARAPRQGQGFALAARIAPVGVLLVGFFYLASSQSPALGQYPPNNGYRPTPQNRTLQTIPQTVPSGRSNRYSIPAAPMSAATGPDARLAAATNATDQPVQSNPTDSDAVAADGESMFEMPALVTKIARGGPLMIPLAICSLIVISLSLERLIALRRSRVIPRPFVRRFTECVEDGQLSFDEANELCEAFDCPVAEVFRAAVRRWGRPMFEVEQAVMDAGDRVADGLRRFLRVFHAISNVAPLIGLLGTVLGMIEAFEMLSGEESLGRSGMLASGISVALMTTAGGLSVAIPAYLAYMYFSSKSDRYLGEIDKLCQRVVDTISAEGLENSGNRRKKRAA